MKYQFVLTLCICLVMPMLEVTAMPVVDYQGIITGFLRPTDWGGLTCGQ